MPGDTGNGATITFSVSGLTLGVYSMKINGEEIPAIEDSLLTDTGYEKYIPGDLKKPMTIDVRYRFNPDVWATLGYATPATRTNDVVTVTFPPGSGQTNGATLAGTAFIVKNGEVELANNKIMEGNLTVHYDGITGPTKTAGS